ncbi:MAG: putative lipid II flippase FtsW [Nitrosomonas sp.]|jgi:cell division protein FtsW|nr:putative lipid II flippase FtsW [Nitrosomonas sp.]
MITSPAPSAISNKTSKPGIDLVLVWTVLFLLGLGLVMMYSASIAIAGAEQGARSTYYLEKQGVAVLCGVFIGLIVFHLLSIQHLRALCPFLLLGGFALLLLVLVPGIGREINGSYRWIPLGVANFQPSELMKLIIVLFTADYAVRRRAHLDHLIRGILPALIILGILAGLLLMQKDYGSLFVITFVMVSILFMGGMNGKSFLLLVGMGAALSVLAVMIEPYRMLRITTFMDPWDDPFNKGYQLSHALIAFGLGEWFGVGLGGSVEKLHYLPEAHTDFMLAVLAEELGFAGVVTVMILFAILLLRAFRIGRHAKELGDHFGALIAYGIGTWFGLQAVINMGVNMGILPTKGLTLPFMSYGGSSMLICCITTALLLRLDWENRQKPSGRGI